MLVVVAVAVVAMAAWVPWAPCEFSGIAWPPRRPRSAGSDTRMGDMLSVSKDHQPIVERKRGQGVRETPRTAARELCAPQCAHSQHTCVPL